MYCKARQYSDEMVCHECNLRWDVNDQYPPDCFQGKSSGKEEDREYLKDKKPSKASKEVGLIALLTAKLACYEPNSSTVKAGLDFLNRRS